jgi:hypothetical protein
MVEVSAVQAETNPEGGRLRNATVSFPLPKHCPNTGYRIQGFIAEEAPGQGVYHPIECLACKRVHLVNPATGEVAGESDNE